MTDKDARAERYRPWLPTPIEHHTHQALKAVADGTADSGQQILFWRWLIYRLSRTYDETYFSDSARDTDYAQGRRYVGLRLINLLNSPVVPENPNNRGLDPHDAERSQ